MTSTKVSSDNDYLIRGVKPLHAPLEPPSLTPLDLLLESPDKKEKNPMKSIWFFGCPTSMQRLAGGGEVFAFYSVHLTDFSFLYAPSRTWRRLPNVPGDCLKT